MCKDDVYGIIVVKSFATTKILHVVLHVRSSTLYSNRQFRQESRLVPRVRHCEKGDTNYLLSLGGSHSQECAKDKDRKKRQKTPILSLYALFPNEGLSGNLSLCIFITYAYMCMHKTEFERNSFLDLVLLCHAS